jgi:hypothetical protein
MIQVRGKLPERAIDDIRPDFRYMTGWLASGSRLNGPLLKVTDADERYSVIVNDKLGQGWIFNKTKGILEVRTVDPGLTMGKPIAIVDGHATLGTGDNFENLLVTLIELQLIKIHYAKDTNIGGKQVLTSSPNRAVIRATTFGKPTSHFEEYTRAALLKMSEVDVPCNQISRLETGDGTFDRAYVLDSFTCVLHETPIIRNSFGVQKEGDLARGKRVILVFNPFECEGIWYLGIEGSLLLRKVTEKKLLRDKVTHDFCRELERYDFIERINREKKDVFAPVTERSSYVVNVHSIDDNGRPTEEPLDLIAYFQSRIDELMNNFYNEKRPDDEYAEFDECMRFLDFLKKCEDAFTVTGKFGPVRTDLKFFYHEVLFGHYFHDSTSIHPPRFMSAVIKLARLSDDIRGGDKKFNEANDFELRSKGEVQGEDVKFCKLARYRAHRLMGTDEASSMRFAEMDMLPTPDGLICQCCGATTLDFSDHIKRRCVFTVEKYGLYTCTMELTSDIAWIREEHIRQGNHSYYYRGGFGPILDKHLEPLTLAQGIRHILNGKGSRSGNGYYYKMQISYYGVVVSPMNAVNENDSRLRDMQLENLVRDKNAEESSDLYQARSKTGRTKQRWTRQQKRDRDGAL